MSVLGQASWNMLNCQNNGVEIHPSCEQLGGLSQRVPLAYILGGVHVLEVSCQKAEVGVITLECGLVSSVFSFPVMQYRGAKEGQLVETTLPKIQGFWF